MKKQKTKSQVQTGVYALKHTGDNNPYSNFIYVVKMLRNKVRSKDTPGPKGPIVKLSLSLNL